MNDTTGKIRFGTVGTGNITHKFLMAALNCEGFALAAVCSRDAQRGAALAEEYGTSVLAKLPIDPELASHCDKGVIELFEGDYLERAADAIEKATN
jgi:predicted dehydrogenase